MEIKRNGWLSGRSNEIERPSCQVAYFINVLRITCCDASTENQRKEDKNGVSIFSLTHSARYAIAYYSENMFLLVTHNFKTVV